MFQGFKDFAFQSIGYNGLSVWVIRFSVRYLVCMYLWSSIVYLRFVFGYAIINGLERIRFMAQDQNWNQGLGFCASKHLQDQQNYQVL